MSIELSEIERKLLDAMERHSSVKEAALAAGLNPQYANQYTENVRKKIGSATKFLQDVRERTRRSKLVDKILTDRR